ncbi:MAG: response regulator transcription factor [Synechococcus sp. ELA619]
MTPSPHATPGAKLSPGPSLLLLGQTALALAPRLEASGYACLQGDRLDPASWGSPDLVVLAVEAAGAIPQLRQHLPSAPLLLDIETDSVMGRSESLSSGADDFWLSSAGPSDLLMRLRLHTNLAKRTAARHDRLRLADLSLVPGRQEAWRGQRSLALTAREFALLQLLLQEAGKVVSRDTILQVVWPDQDRAASNIIEVYVRYLRQKLELGGERRLIHTVRGQGYCLAESLPKTLPKAAPKEPELRHPPASGTTGP